MQVVKYLEDHNRAGEVETFKKNINGVMKNLLGKFKDLQFYQGERSLTLLCTFGCFFWCFFFRYLLVSSLPVFRGFDFMLTGLQYFPLWF
jgi:hypothetical protein